MDEKNILYIVFFTEKSSKKRNGKNISVPIVREYLPWLALNIKALATSFWINILKNPEKVLKNNCVNKSIIIDNTPKNTTKELTRVIDLGCSLIKINPIKKIKIEIIRL